MRSQQVQGQGPRVTGEEPTCAGYEANMYRARGNCIDCLVTHWNTFIATDFKYNAK